MHWQQGGVRKVEKSCIASLEPIPRVKEELVHFFCIFGFWGCGLLYEIGLTDFGGTGLTGLCPELALVQGSSCMLWCLCSLLEHGFVSDVSSRCPCLRGPRLVFFK
jgi:hypothetical protein